MTTPEPRSAPSRGGTARPRREGDSGWAATDDAESPRFTPRDRDRDTRTRPDIPAARDDPPSRDKPARDKPPLRDKPAEGVKPPTRGPGQAAARGGAEPGPAPAELRPGPALRWVGTLPVRAALIVFFGAAALGAVATLATGGSPGGWLANLILVGSVIAALGIERPALYLFIPLPALTYLVLATLTGVIQDGGNDTSMTDWGVSFLQWIGDGFLSLLATTVLVLIIFGGRLMASRQLVSGSFPMSDRRPDPEPSAAARPERTERPKRTERTERPARRDDPRQVTRGPREDPDPWYDAPRDREPRKDREARKERDRPVGREGRGDKSGRRPDRPPADDSRWSTDGWSLDNNSRDTRDR